MMVIRHRSALFSVALAALLVSTFVGAGASAAAAVRLAANSCDTARAFFGLHGMGEGPDGAQPFLADSTLLRDLDDAQNAISGAVGYQPVPYESVKISLYDDLRERSISKPLTDAVQDGENNLQETLKSWTQGCKPSQDKIVLVGYSMGAWVINKWLVDHHKEWSMIKGVQLYGDPCWINGSDVGLARGFGATGCIPASSYPAPVAGAKIPVESWCAHLDGVCGQDWGAKGNPVALSDELSNAIGCTVLPNCNHKQYWYDGSSTSDLVQGAKLMVQWLGAPVLV